MPDQQQSSNWTSMVPEVYYDLISRVPGGTLLLLWLLQRAGISIDVTQMKDMDWGPSVISLVLLLGGGYVVGMLLTPLGECAFESYRKALWKRRLAGHLGLVTKFNDQQGLGLPKEGNGTVDLKKSTGQELYRLDRHIHDYLKREDEHARVILPKMRAEAGLCNNLTAAWVVFAVCSAALGDISVTFHAVGFWQLSLLALPVLLSGWGGWTRSGSLTERQYSLLRLVIKAKGAGAPGA